MKKFFIIFVSVLLMFGMIAEARTSKGGSVSVTATAQTVTLAGRHFVLVNDGANEVFVRYGLDSESAGTASVADFQLNSGESITSDSDNNISSASVVCSPAETATVRYLSWE